jgi:hypothetical protein
MPLNVNLRELSHVPRSDDASLASHDLDANLSSVTAYVLYVYHELSEMVRLGYTEDSLYGDDGEWTMGGHIVARDDGCS